MTTAGKRHNLVTFERQGPPIDDGYTTKPGAFAELGKAWAEILYGTGQERREAAQEAGSQAATFIVPWTPLLASVVLTDRISFDGDAWDITSAAPIGLNREIHFTAVRNT